MLFGLLVQEGVTQAPSIVTLDGLEGPPDFSAADGTRSVMRIALKRFGAKLVNISITIIPVAVGVIVVPVALLVSAYSFYRKKKRRV